MSQIIVRRQTAFVVVSEANGTRLLRPTELSVVSHESKPKSHPATQECRRDKTSSHVSSDLCITVSMGGKRTALVGSNSGRGNRAQIRQLCAAICRHYA